MRGLLALVLVLFGCSLACQQPVATGGGGTAEEGLAGQAGPTATVAAATERTSAGDMPGEPSEQSLVTIESPVTTCFPHRGLHSWSWWKTFLRWSPDGREIFVTRGPVLFAAKTDGTSVRAIARGPVDFLKVISTMIPL